MLRLLNYKLLLVSSLFLFSQNILADEAKAKLNQEATVLEGAFAKEANKDSQKIDSKKFLAELKSGKIEQSFGSRMRGLLGCLAMLAIAVAFSTNRRKINWRTVGFGMGIQFLFAFIALKLPFGKLFFDYANDLVIKVLSFSTEGSKFLFGNLVGFNVPVKTAAGATTSYIADTGSFFAFNVLPTIVFFSALTAVLYHLRILEFVVRIMAAIMQKTMRVSGAESFASAANIFIGQTESPLLVKPFLAKMTNSEIMAVMSGGFATVAGGVLAAYVAILMGYFPDIAGHLIAASVMSAPAALVMAKVMFPETQVPETASASQIKVEREDDNIIDAAARGTSDGLMLALNVGAMLISFIALIAFLNWILSSVTGLLGFGVISLETIFSWIGAPLAYLMGVPWADAPFVGSLIGTKTVINEMVAYLQLTEEIQLGQLTHAKSVVIATYALCGFSNFSSIGIQIGGMSALAKTRRKDFAKIGLRAMVAGSLACFQTAAIAGMLL